MQKHVEYRCLRDGKCQVMRINRNRCQYCRFKKCLVVGMSRDCKLILSVVDPVPQKQFGIMTLGNVIGWLL